MLSRLMTIREQVILGSLALSIFTGAVVLGFRAAPSQSGTTILKPPTPPTRSLGLPAPTPISPTTPKQQIAVGILGAIANPGLYHLPRDTRVADLIEAAGGSNARADVSDLNLAAHLADGSTLEVPYRDAKPPINPALYTLSGTRTTHEAPTNLATYDAAPPHAAATARVNINAASRAELESLPGIGPATADKILAHRRLQPFRRAEDLLQVSGIGPAKLTAIAPLVRFR